MADRRSGRERRTAQRFKVTIDVEFEIDTIRRAGTLSDISSVGCFILASGDFQDGSAVRVFLPLSDGMKVQFSAEVSNHVFDIGFAAKFVNLTAAQKEFIENFVAMNKQD